MAVLNPHFRTEHQERHIMLTRYADAGGANILLQDAHSLNIFIDTLEEGHSIILDNIASFINQQHAQVMNIKMLLALLIQAINIFNNKLMRFLVLDNFLTAQLINLRHGLVRQVHRTAALPAFCNPGMHVRVNNALVHKPFVVRS